VEASEQSHLTQLCSVKTSPIHCVSPKGEPVLTVLVPVEAWDAINWADWFVTTQTDLHVADWASATTLVVVF
jgi:hypothetical protein